MPDPTANFFPSKWWFKIFIWAFKSILDLSASVLLYSVNPNNGYIRFLEFLAISKLANSDHCLTCAFSKAFDPSNSGLNDSTK